MLSVFVRSFFIYVAIRIVGGTFTLSSLLLVFGIHQKPSILHVAIDGFYRGSHTVFLEEVSAKGCCSVRVRSYRSDLLSDEFGSSNLLLISGRLD